MWRKKGFLEHTFHLRKLQESRTTVEICLRSLGSPTSLSSLNLQPLSRQAAFSVVLKNYGLQRILSEAGAVERAGCLAYSYCRSNIGGAQPAFHWRKSWAGEGVLGEKKCLSFSEPQENEGRALARLPERSHRCWVTVFIERNANWSSPKVIFLVKRKPLGIGLFR